MHDFVELLARDLLPQIRELGTVSAKIERELAGTLARQLTRDFDHVVDALVRFDAAREQHPEWSARSGNRRCNVRELANLIAGQVLKYRDAFVADEFGELFADRSRSGHHGREMP